ncbi:cytochrome c nitrate reductase, small subunit [Anaeromyxobacter sp. K]|uniref:Cytochrome c nitrate reductase, small subunit n=1 Tax=Anaeromyxobacter dehalogenans (strain ATCC BAA-258 / DSM 21875 / 2CP-1) TaxID=455488 RepID=B8JEI9_ANAD2|nr:MULTISPECIES: cytochrome c nitrite reductase small subunit [Anaeromyxobacter]ACG72196.1 cytochrome c nitrate reductase, small subunit [Anaeromyxobacter sp. K]ACL64315.1 cytochrome c nitrate reductase, small subunit [Anaeromyxobacter dehalogenans 2CP-1]
MRKGSSLLSLPVVLLAAAAGAAVGVGGYAFAYAKGTSYLGNDPATCSNCHVMSGHYAGWQASAHHAVATCNDCHTPAATVSKYAVKAENGWHHSMAFTVGGFPDVIRARAESSAVIEGQCRHCHAQIVDAMTGGRDGVSCIRCHASVGHLR